MENENNTHRTVCSVSFHLCLEKSKIIYAYACIYTGDSGNMHRKMVTAAAPTRGNGCLGGGVSINGG